MTLYNPIGREVKYWARIPVTGHYSVMGANMQMIQADVNYILYNLNIFSEIGFSKNMKYLIKHA